MPTFGGVRRRHVAFLLNHGYRAGGSDQLSSVLAQGEVVESLGLSAQLLAVLGYEHEGALPSFTVSSLAVTPSTVTIFTVSSTLARET